MYESVLYLEENLQNSIYHAHASAHESKKRYDELNKVITYGLKTMKPPRRLVQIVWNWVRNRLRLCKGNKDNMYSMVLVDLLINYWILTTYTTEQKLQTDGRVMFIALTK